MRRATGKSIAFVAGICFLLILALTPGCGGGDETPSTTAVSQQKPQKESARAELSPVGGSGASGFAVLTKEGYGGTMKVRVQGLEPAEGSSQYGLWLLKGPDTSSLEGREDMKALATYHVGSNGRLAVDFPPPSLGVARVEEGKLLHLLLTRIDDRERVAKSIVRYDKTRILPDLGPTVARGVFKGSLVGATE